MSSSGGKKTLKTGLLLDASYSDSDGESVIRLFIKCGKKAKWFSVDGFRPYFYVLASEEEAEKTAKELEGLTLGESESFKILKASNSGMRHGGKAVLKLEFGKVGHVVQARKHLRDMGFERYEYDIPFGKRYLIDSNLEPGNGIRFEEKGGEIFWAEKQDAPFKVKNKAFDLETYWGGKMEIGAEPIVMASLVEKGKKGRVISYKTREVPGLEVLGGEKELVAELEKELNGTDLIVTYNGDNFDFPYLNERAKKIKSGFEINGEKPRGMRRGMNNATKLSGIQHIDSYQIMRFLQRTGSVDIVKLGIENVSEKIFGIEKEKVYPEEINTAWESGEGLERLVDYNLKDSEVALRIAEDYLPLFVEISKLTSQTLFDTTRNSTSSMVEDLLVKEVHRRKVVVPNKPKEPEIRQREMNPIKGGFVKEPKSGLHEGIAVVDFASLYPSIIISHNISPETLNCGHMECRKNKSPEGTWFCKKERGLFPEILEKMLKERLKLKKEYKEKKNKGNDDKVLFARQWALKIILNSAYGYLGYPRARWYSREGASATTAWAREYIQKTIKDAEKEGFEVLYGDSITKERFVTIKNPKGFIEVKNIEDFYKEISVLRRERGTKQIKPVEGYYALSINPKTKLPEWKKINEIIRHKTKKNIFRINQKYGEIVATEDHSILAETKNGFSETRPEKMKGKKFYQVSKIPKSNNIKEIDFFDILKENMYDRRHKTKTKISQWHTDGKYMWFGFFNKKKPVKLKRKIETNSKDFGRLCRLCGAYVAEGSSSTIETSKNKNGASIASSDIKWLKNLEKDYHMLFKNAKTCVIPSTKKQRRITCNNKKINYLDKTHKLQMMNETSAQFFKGLCGQKSNGKHLPKFIFNVPKKFKLLLLEKAIEGDGSKSVNKKLGYTKNYIKNNFQYTTNSVELISGISLLLKQLGRTYSIQYRPEKKAYTIKTSTKNNSRTITRITKEPYEGFVYDLNVETNNNFVDSCGQVLLHNTDSNFLKLNGKKGKKEVEEFLGKINSELPEGMELELDGIYKRGIFVTKKEGGAAKKRYALIDEKGNLKIVGFEYVRRDWSNIAKETQKKVIELVLKKGEPEEAARHVRKVVKELKAGNVPKEELAIITTLKRKPEDYVSKGPHVAAAEKAANRGAELDVGSVLSYVVTKSGKSISEKAELEEFVEEGNYDPDYYIENQVLPAVIRIMRELGYSKQDMIEGGTQTGLGQWG